MSRTVKITIGLVLAATVLLVAGLFVMNRLHSGTDSAMDTNSQPESQPIQPGSDQVTAQPTDTAPTPAAEDTPTPSGVQAPAMTADEAKRLAAKLVSQDKATYESAWVDGEAPPLSPTGTQITIDSSTFYSLDRAGRVNAAITLPGHAPETWRLLLEYIDGQWRVYTSEAV